MWYLTGLSHGIINNHKTTDTSPHEIISRDYQYVTWDFLIRLSWGYQYISWDYLNNPETCGEWRWRSDLVKLAGISTLRVSDHSEPQYATVHLLHPLLLLPSAAAAASSRSGSIVWCRVIAGRRFIGLMTLLLLLLLLLLLTSCRLLTS